jgi:cytochrome c
MKFAKQVFAAAASIAVLTGPAVADERATKADVISQVNAVVALYKKVGKDQAIQEVNTAPAFKIKGMNVMIQSNGFALASSLNPKLVGKNMLEVKDPNGVEFAKECLRIARLPGDNWVEYQFINPETKKVEDRIMHCKALPGTDAVTSAAISKT